MARRVAATSGEAALRATAPAARPGCCPGFDYATMRPLGVASRFAGGVPGSNTHRSHRGRQGLRRVVYTELVGGFDRLLPPLQVEPDLDYVVYSDTEAAPPAPWQLRPLACRQRNARMTARWHKLHPHLLFPDRDESLHIDANVLIRERVSGLFDVMLQEAPLALFRHPDRECVYDEAEVVKRVRYDDPEIVDLQMGYYRAQGLPRRAGLYHAAAQFRRHADPKLAAMLEDWWRQLKLFSHRDQLSLPYVLRQHAMAVAILPGGAAINSWFATAPHERFRVELASDPLPPEADAGDWLRAAFIAAERERNLRRHGSWPARRQAIVRSARAPLGRLRVEFRKYLWRRYLARLQRAGGTSA